MASLLHLHTNAALPFGSPTSFPCVDCGLLTVTGEYCDGSPHTVGFNGCLATNRIATDYPAEQYDGMYTPLCTYCETRHDHCRFCRRVSSCTPPTRKHHWSETHEEPPRHNAEICSLPNENQRLEAANEVLTRKLHQAQLVERTLLQTGISRETDLAGLEEEIRRLKLQYEGSPPEEDQANSTHCMICTNCTMEITIRTNPVQGITMEGASLLYPKTTHGSNDLNNSNLRYWMCTPCYEDLLLDGTPYWNVNRTVRDLNRDPGQQRQQPNRDPDQRRWAWLETWKWQRHPTRKRGGWSLQDSGWHLIDFSN